MRRVSAALVLLATLVAGCSDGAPSETQVLQVPDDASGSQDEGDAKDSTRSKSDDKKRGDDPSAAADVGDASGNGAGDDPSTDEGSTTGTDGGSSGGSGSPGGSGSSDSSGSQPSEAGPSDVLYPAAGRYEYAQEGYREFCSGSCDREKLPSRALTTAKVSATSDAGATVVTEQRSDGGTVRATTRYKDRAAFVTAVYTRMSYGAFAFERTYRPDPPVMQLVSELEVGRHWEGSWSAEVSGDYEAAVVSEEQVRVGDRQISAMKIFTVTNFRGEFRGRSDVTTWIDPRTLAVVKTDGFVNLESSFGTYATRFKTTLLSAPRYR